MRLLDNGTLPLVGVLLDVDVGEGSVLLGVDGLLTLEPKAT